MDLSSKQCIPCRGGTPPLKGTQLIQLRDQLEYGWEIVDEHHLSKNFKFVDFTAALTHVLGKQAQPSTDWVYLRNSST